MITQDLLTYIKEQLQKGIRKETIKANLKRSNWTQEDIEAGFARIRGLVSERVNFSMPTFPFSFVRRKIAFIIAAVFIAIVLLVIAIGSPTTPDSEWSAWEPVETYTSSDYGFSITLPLGWKYNTNPTFLDEEGNEIPVSEAAETLAVSLGKPEANIFLPIFIERKAWENVVAEAERNLGADFIEEAFFGGQRALKVTEQLSGIGYSYYFRIQHLNQEDVLVGSVDFLGAEFDDTPAFKEQAETILNSLVFH